MNAALNTYDGLTAHYYASSKVKYVVIGRNSDITLEHRIYQTTVSGKVEARDIAKMFNARPWNF